MLHVDTHSQIKPFRKTCTVLLAETSEFMYQFTKRLQSSSPRQSGLSPSLKVHGHGQTHSRNFCRFKLDI